MANILITGSEGSLMQETIPFLLDKGHNVFGVDNLSRHWKKNYVNSSKYIFSYGDASNPNEMEDIFTKYGPFDYVIQAAATIFGVGGFNDNCSKIINTDVAIQSNMINLSVKHNVKKFVYISSSMVYETCKPNPYGNKEHEPGLSVTPKTDYGLSKLVGERMVEAAFRQHKLDYIIWRPFNIITPKEQAENIQGYSHVFADFINVIIGEKSKEIPIIGSGQQIRCFTWIKDVAKVIAEHSFAVDMIPDNVFNIGSTEPITMRGLAVKIANIGYKLGLCDGGPLDFKTTKEYKNDVEYRIPNISKLNSKIGSDWKTKNLDESLEECIMYFSRNKLKW
jgi:nucleoside-diphosphate-sugar epimerase